MTQSIPEPLRGAPARAAALLTAALCLALLVLAPAASADYEQMPEHFGTSGEAAGQLKESTAIAVDSSGEGLPPGEAGSFYVVGGERRLLRYAPGSEGEEPEFREAWGWGVGSTAQQFQRCGPAYEGKADPTTEHTFETCVFASPGSGEEPGHFGALSGVAVDQATGYVYVLNVKNGVKQHHLIEVFTATGTYVGGFGDVGRETPAPAESIAEGPEKLHPRIGARVGAIAVDDAGTVYVNDADYETAPAPKQARVMSFEPCSAGEYDNYCYAGQEHDIVSAQYAQPFFRIALASSDQLVTTNAELIRSYRLGEEHPVPLCSLSVSGQLQAMTANPDTGEIFYQTFSDRKVHRLGPCDPDTGNYEELQSAVKWAPLAKSMNALAVNPTRSWGLLRPPGVLYGADYENATGYVLAPAKGPSKALTVSRGGSGSGTVTSSPAGISCGSECEAEFLEGETVTLAASATAGSTFSGWSGECASVSGNEC
ncbi:MAG: hypothetical protein WBW92_14135, partial [Rhodanobacteraceae bacterium]